MNNTANPQPSTPLAAASEACYEAFNHCRTPAFLLDACRSLARHRAVGMALQAPFPAG